MSRSLFLLEQSFGMLVSVWFDLLAKEGIHGTVTSTRRTTSEQAELFARSQAGLSPLPAAPPGQSLHEQGLAIDVVFPRAHLARAVQLAELVGIRWGGQGDPVHFEATEQGLARVKRQEIPIGRLSSPLTALAAWFGARLARRQQHKPEIRPQEAPRATPRCSC